MSAPLEGLRVLDFTKFLPGPYCTWLLGDLGADIIRLENPRELAKQAKVFGWDRLDPAARARLRAHDNFARNKRSLLIDPGAAEARAVILELVRRADILVEDYRPGIMESMGLGYGAMQAINPALIYCSVSLCGQTGPAQTKPGHDPVALALSGALSRIGEDPDMPGFPGVPVADLLSGSNAVIGILSAVIARARNGIGQQVDIAMSDSAMALIGTAVSRFPDLAQVPLRGRRRIDSGIWRCADGGLIVTTDMEPRYWQRFCAAIGHPDFAERQHDAAGFAQMRAAIAAAFAGKPRADWLDILAAADTQFAPVLDVAEALDHPHNIARGMALDLPLPDGGSVRQIGSPIHLSETPVRAAVPAREAGADGADILAELGLSDDDIQALAATGALALQGQ
jgi:crotonobetainyl-CoA:carnitine CoA-transferase CaiB-like acyl-CoA transferase